MSLEEVEFPLEEDPTDGADDFAKVQGHCLKPSTGSQTL